MRDLPAAAGQSVACTEVALLKGDADDYDYPFLGAAVPGTALGSAT